MAKKKDNSANVYVALGLARIGLGFIFLWAFLDKLFGLGFATCRNADTGAVETMCSKAWIEGGSPTTGFLKFGTDGPLADFYASLAGNGFVDLLFMVGLLGIGIALLFGIGVRIAAITGSIMMLMMWSAVLLPENNPLVDDHIIYVLVLAAIWYGNDKQRFGLGAWWAKQDIVKNYPILK